MEKSKAAEPLDEFARRDETFGPEVVFQKAPPAQNDSPFGGHRFFGQADIEPQTRTMEVTLVDIEGNTVFSKALTPTN